MSNKVFRYILSFLGKQNETNRFNSSDPQWRKIVLYSHSPEDWLVLEPVMLELIQQFKLPLSFITTNRKDPIRHMPPTNILPFFTEYRRLRHRFLRSIECETLVVCNVLAMQRPFPVSMRVKNYVFLIPSLKSIQAAICPENLQVFNTFLCASHSQMSDLLQYQQDSGRMIQIVPCGSPRLDRIFALNSDTSRITEKIPTIFFSFTNPDLEYRDSMCAKVIQKLLENNYRVIFRAPGAWMDRMGRFIRPLYERFARRELFYPDGEQPSKYSIYHTDILVTDSSELGSEMACALKYPVLLLGLDEQSDEPKCTFERSVTDIVGGKVSSTQLDTIPERIRLLLANRQLISHQLAQLNQKEILNPRRFALTTALYLAGKLTMPEITTQANIPSLSV